ncbi:hypothetical protein MLD38_000433 [Melastoma candidum]|uniref:Uncharacterized protein n=1 Tax=Melastoma candidum TaxID=119954 RepID=A0ACB9SA63_9MYRT|nr:hypothetical protein MLD38_000433 [Melastoma candidum]
MAIPKPKLFPSKTTTDSTPPSSSSSSSSSLLPSNVIPSPPPPSLSRNRRLPPRKNLLPSSHSPLPPPPPPPPPPTSTPTPTLTPLLLLRRRDTRCLLLLLLPLAYFFGVVICLCPFLRDPIPGSVYRSHVVFRQMLPHLSSLPNSSSLQLETLWTHRRRLKEQKPCPSTGHGRQLAGDSEANQTTGYLIVEANGGLNQQRSAICNAVAVAAILNAILVIPQFEFNEVWKDPSKLGDIYDDDHFISTLNGHIKVVRQLPPSVTEKYTDNFTSIPNLRVPAWATLKYYETEVSPILRTHGVIRLAPFANRLSMNMPPRIQLLRCLTNFKALRFSSSILMLADKLIQRMRDRSSKSGGKYVSVHLRFEEDMVAFSCCAYEGGEAEKVELEAIRERQWKGKFKRKDRVISPGLNRIEGKCPMTPLEVGMMLRGMGFDNNTSIYLASGKVYQPDRYMTPLLEMFPLIYSKESLATPEELFSFEGYSSRLAALDYTVCLHSEAFVTTQGGNFPHFLMGQRRFLFDGHSKTIKPDKHKLVRLLQDGMRWADFKHEMETMLRESDHKASVVPRVKKFNRKTSIYAFPFPECRCLQSLGNSSWTLPDFNSRDSQLKNDG